MQCPILKIDSEKEFPSLGAVKTTKPKPSSPQRMALWLDHLKVPHFFVLYKNNQVQCIQRTIRLVCRDKTGTQKQSRLFDAGIFKSVKHYPCVYDPPRKEYKDDEEFYDGYRGPTSEDSYGWMETDNSGRQSWAY